MSQGTPAVEIQTRLKTDDAKQEAQSFAQQLLGNIMPTIDVANLAAKAFGKIKDAISGSLEAAVESEATQRKLEVALRKSGDATGEVFAATQELNAELLQKLGIDDDDLAATQTKLLALGLQKEKLGDATRATIGLAEATGKDLGSAAKQVAKAFAEGGAETARLTAMFALAEAQAMTTAGQFKRLEAAGGEVRETIGGIVTESSSFQRELTNATNEVGALQRALETAKPWLTDVFDFLIDTGREALNGGGIAAPFKIINDRLQEALGGTQFTTEQLPFEAPAAPGSIANPEKESNSPFRVKSEDELFGPWERAVAGANASPSGESDFMKAARDRDRRAESDARQSVIEIDLQRERDRIAAEEAIRDAADAARVRQIDRETAHEASLNKMHREAHAERLAGEKAFWGQIGSLVGGGVANYLAGTAAAIGAGENMGDASRKLLGGFLVSMGQAAVSIGTTAVLAGTLGQLVPFLFPVTGGAPGALAGAALVAGGLLAIGVGTAMGGSGSAPATATPSSGGGGGGPVSSTGADAGFVPGSDGGGMTQIVNISLGVGESGRGLSGFVFGTAREFGRVIRDGLDFAGTLLPGRPK